tara:strand:- start:1956 stop:2513 length:558 start_codon:yes stop_codon:yes gene_type:complete
MKFETFIKGETVDLVLLTEEIAAKTDWYSWFNDQKLTKLLKQGYFPNTPEDQVLYFKKNIESGKRLQLGVVIKKINKFIGVVSLSEINHYDRNAEISSIFNINSKHINSLKFFKEAQVLLINHAFNKLNLRRIGSFVSDKKLAKLNQKIFGFKCEGQLKERDYINGKFVDKYILSILKKNWKYEA